MKKKIEWYDSIETKITCPKRKKKRFWWIVAKRTVPLNDDRATAVWIVVLAWSYDSNWTSSACNRNIMTGIWVYLTWIRCNIVIRAYLLVWHSLRIIVICNLVKIWKNFSFLTTSLNRYILLLENVVVIIEVCRMCDTWTTKSHQNASVSSIDIDISYYYELYNWRAKRCKIIPLPKINCIHCPVYACIPFYILFYILQLLSCL